MKFGAGVTTGQQAHLTMRAVHMLTICGMTLTMAAAVRAQEIEEIDWKKVDEASPSGRPSRSAAGRRSSRCTMRSW
jgi:hypothetical protein